MKLTREKARPAGIFLIFLMMTITVPYQSVLAAMIGTEATLDSARAQQGRDEIKNLLLRDDVQKALMAQGIDPVEAKKRVDSFSDAEIIRIADEIDELPAGGYIGPPAWIIIVVAVAVILGVYLFLSAVTPPAEIEK